MTENYKILTENIISNTIKESETLEFKNYQFKDGKFNSLDSKNSNTLLKEVCAFANTNGGKIIIGISEDNNHNPSVINDTLVNKENFEAWEQSFRNKIATKTIPSIYGINVAHICIENKNCIIIDVPKSLIKPHAYDDGEHRFYKRNGNESRPMRYSDMKKNFIELGINQQKITNFIEERISAILDGEIHDTLSSNGSLVIHIIPESSLDITNFLDTKIFYNNKNLDVITPDFSKFTYYNANGLLKTYENSYCFGSYIQLFTDGKIEAGESRLVSYFKDNKPNEIYHWDKFEKIIAEKIYKYCHEFYTLNLDTTFYITLTLLNVKDKYSISEYGFNDISL